MKKYNFLGFLFFALSFFSIINAQVTLNSSVFYSSGDSLVYNIDTATYIGSARPLGSANQTWDFSGAKNHGRRSEVYRNPSTGAGFSSFPNANVMQRQGFQERYYRNTAVNFEELGYFIPIGAGGGAGFPIPTGATVYSKPYIIQKSPYTFNSAFSSNYSFTITVGSDFLPDSLASQFPADSFRLKNTVTVDKAVKGWGTLKLSGKDWDVLLEDRVSTTVSKIEAKLAFVGWVDITAVAGPLVGDLFGSRLPSKSSAFLTNNVKGALLVCNLDSAENISLVQFRTNPPILGIDKQKVNRFEAFFDNNGSDIHINNLDQLKEIKVLLYSENGSEVFNKQINAIQTEINLSINSAAGKVFMLAIFDTNGDLIFNKKLIR